MSINKFEDVIAWKKANVFAIEIYKTFKNCNDFYFTNQINRAALSIMNNIAEGFERKTNNELKNFLYIAKGSCGEVRSMLHLAIQLNHISNQQFTYFYNSIIEISKLLAGFIKSI